MYPGGILRQQTDYFPRKHALDLAGYFHDDLGLWIVSGFRQPVYHGYPDFFSDLLSESPHRIPEKLGMVFLRF